MIDHLLCADWSKEHKGRALYAADVRAREVYCAGVTRLTVRSALGKASELAKRGNVLLSFDLPLGLPYSFFSAIRKTPDWNGASNFIEFLLIAARIPSFFVSGGDASDWSVYKPFFGVPSGQGARMAFEAKAEREGIQLRRAIERKTRGNPVFITSGIPGSVGSGAIDAWKELASLFTPERDFRMWPFEGTLSDLFTRSRIVVAENYPRAIYAAALSECPPHRRPLLQISKTNADVRRSALERLMSRPWVEQYEVSLKDTSAALVDENAFDALLTAAGLLRVLLDDEPLFSPKFEDAVAEGGILGTGTINVDLPQRSLPSGGRKRTSRTTPKLIVVAESQVDDPNKSKSVLTYECPIPKCTKRFVGSRGGWDGHAGSHRNHPDWHPDVTRHEDRVELFRVEFPRFFSSTEPMRTKSSRF